MKEFAKKTIDFFLKPFNENLPFFAALSVLAGTADAVFWVKEGDPVFGGYMGIHAMVMCFAVALLTGFFKGWPEKTIKTIFLVLGFVNLVIDAGVHSIMGFGFTYDMVAIIMGTNVQESAEFVKLYINAPMLVCVSITTAVAILILIFRKRLKTLLPRMLQLVALTAVILCAGVIFVRGSRNWKGVFLNKFYCFATYKPAVDLGQYSRVYDLERVREDKPDNIVIIIGESLTKTHMSAYGYEKETTPLLCANGNAVLFPNVKSPATATIQSFKRFMTTVEEENIDRWYECPKLPDVMKSAGYTLSWISNQSPAGIHDNLVARFAELADTTIWCGNKAMGMGKKDYDEIVLPEIDMDIERFPHGHCTIIHLMGNHGNFNLRYPQDYAVFSEDDYKDFPKNQRVLRAEYDNSVLYNDMIVDAIFKKFSVMECPVIYFPDHAIDVFDSDKDYIGHARLNDPVSVAAGRNIPLVIFLPESYQKSFPEMTARIRASADNEFNTGNITYALMDLAGVSFKDESNVLDSMTLFRKKVREK